MGENCKDKKFHYGGQAVIEGVMMRGPKDFAIAVRRINGEIVDTREDVESILGRFKWLNKPFLRGTLALIDSMALGIKALKYSADIAMDDAMELEKKENELKANNNPEPENAKKTISDVDTKQKEKTGKVNDAVVGITMVLGILLGLAVFFFIPILIVRPLKEIVPERWMLAIIEGCVKILLFVGYVFAISFLKDIRRVFQYHGAEHKVINTLESGDALTLENVTKHTKVHVRCGTSFILVVLITGIVIFMFVPWDNVFLRLLYKLLLMPIVAGIAYEIIKLAGNRKDSVFMRMLLMPGLAMQSITTREPEPQMIEVAIRSLELVMDAEKNECITTEDPSTELN